jgi:adenylosuccinate synthase
MPATVVVGGFYGDEGKGKIVGYLSIADNVDIGVRGGVGPNAGHTVVVDGKEFKVRQVPSAFVNKKSLLLIGPGVLINPEVLFNEIKIAETEGRLYLDKNCGIIEKKHIELDSSDAHLKGTVGTTGTGTGPANAERVLRKLKIAKDLPELQKYLADVPEILNDALAYGKSILIEGTQGTFLSLWHTDCYPFCTSKDTTASAICSDVGLGPKNVDEVIVVFKSYVTRVGEGPLENEYTEEEAKKLGTFEIATVTGRKRRSAPFNFKLAKRAVMLNSATQLAITKLDVLFPQASGVREYEKLPKEAKEFIEKIENELKVPVTLIGTGKETKDVIDMRKEKL